MTTSRRRRHRHRRHRAPRGPCRHRSAACHPATVRTAHPAGSGPAGPAHHRGARGHSGRSGRWPAAPQLLRRRPRRRNRWPGPRRSRSSCPTTPAVQRPVRTRAGRHTPPARAGRTQPVDEPRRRQARWWSSPTAPRRRHRPSGRSGAGPWSAGPRSASRWLAGRWLAGRWLAGRCPCRRAWVPNLCPCCGGDIGWLGPTTCRLHHRALTGFPQAKHPALPVRCGVLLA